MACKRLASLAYKVGTLVVSRALQLDVEFSLIKVCLAFHRVNERNIFPLIFFI